ncbi:NAD-dependent epimerase/dehydratase family protein [Actinomadura atramentaria]|uniref:NAD-dependent epimerase/dehydratase family protein n=1 Tax=Actinomadura atramentaria TaxID=1990 RepID=UPI000475CF3E|nr:NAD-dependent epimerase/dehydratase family protein [Actinomadura atramentaria]
MKVVVTGAAGFVGGHVAEALARAGHAVLAVDAPARSLTPPRAEAAFAALGGVPGVVLRRLDLAEDTLEPLADADAVVHLAGRPGVRTSWGAGRALVFRDNVEATRRLLEACRENRPKVIVASSSSVYGAARRKPSRETDALAPASPYAESKVEVERLAAKAAADGVGVAVLRYFSVYGPRQRPDMAFHRFIEAALDGRPLPLFGDGRQLRSFTHVRDVVAATVAAVERDLPVGATVNVGGGEPVAVRDAIALIADLAGVPATVREQPPVAGDVPRTWADTGRAADLLGWRPTVPLGAGLAEQIAWHRSER